ncbi:MAG TPA: MATE family efflux transporter [bacterium]|nr:MATE family efflux transporter [bacterium]HPS31032.1 MATE family efflux transporter [bacterium]
MSENFYKRALAIAVPIAIHNLIISSINMADVFMVGQLGESAIAALGISNQLMFLFILFLFGMGSGGSIFISQFYGKKDRVNLHRVIGIMMVPALAISIIMASGAIFIPKVLMSVFSKDAEVLDQSARYLMIVGLSYPFTAISVIYQVVLRSTDKPVIPMYTSFFALIINISFNWLLIFGNMGFPKFGIEGAAIATVIARVLETLLTVFIVYYTKSVAAAKIKVMLDFKMDLIKKVFVTSMPVFINESVWASGIVVLNIIFASLGTESIAAVNIMDSVGRLSFAAFIGIANAGAVVLGTDIGAQKYDAVWEHSKKFASMSIYAGIAVSIILFITAPSVISIYNISATVSDLAYKTLLVWVFMIPIVSFNCLNIVGILRSGGDTRAALWIDIGALWAIGVPLAFIGAYYFSLPIYLVYLLSKTEEIFKFIFGFKRYLSKKWIKNLVEEF